MLKKPSVVQTDLIILSLWSSDQPLCKWDSNDYANGIYGGRIRG